jgi:hypothetical protein
MFGKLGQLGQLGRIADTTLISLRFLLPQFAILASYKLG